MNQETTNRWVEALRSGDYKQGSMRLRSHDNNFCCLGVLCDIVDPEGWTQKEGSWVHHDRQAYLSKRLMTEIGLNESDQGRLTAMNDIWDYDFDTIANEIEMLFPRQ